MSDQPFRLPPDRHPEELGGTCPFLSIASAVMAVVQATMESHDNTRRPTPIEDINQMWTHAGRCPRSRKCEIWDERLNRCGLKGYTT